MQTRIYLIQESRFFKGQVRGINCKDNQLVYHRDGLRPGTVISKKGVQSNVEPGFTTRDLVVVQIKCGEGKERMWW